MAKATILVIEDDPEISELLSFSLAKEGWTVVIAEDGESGLAKLPAAKPDCVVLDIMLPGMDGLEILKALKADPERKRLPVIMTTAKGEESDVVAGLELGAEDYVVKPYSPKVLIARIRRPFEGRSTNRAAPAPKPPSSPWAASRSTRSGTRFASVRPRSISRPPSSPYSRSSCEAPAGSSRGAGS